MALPPAHLFIGAAAGEALRNTGTPPWRAWAFGGFVAVLPDLDSVLRLVAGSSAPDHGRYTHTLLATVAVALLVGGLLGRRWGIVGGAAWASHLLVDLLREGSATSVYLLGPFVARSLPSLAPVFPVVPFEWTGAPGFFPQLHGSAPLHALAVQTLIGGVLFALAVGGSYVLRHRQRRTLLR